MDQLNIGDKLQSLDKAVQKLKLELFFGRSTSMKSISQDHDFVNQIRKIRKQRWLAKYAGKI